MVQNEACPFIYADHSPIGDGSLVAQEREFLVELRERALALKRPGKSAEEEAGNSPLSLRANIPNETSTI